MSVEDSGTMVQISQNKEIIRTHLLLEISADYMGLVPEVGLEPTRYCYQRILSPSRLPVPSFRRKGICAPKRMPAAGKRRGACAPAVNIVAHRAVVGKKKLPLRPVLPPALPVHVNFSDRARRVTAACPSPSRPLSCPCA